MKKITLTVEFNDLGEMVTHFDTYQGDALSPTEYGRAAAAIAIATEQLRQTMAEAYAKDGFPEAQDDLSAAYEATMAEGTESTSTRVSKNKGAKPA